MRDTIRPLAAEFLGTFAFVFIGAGAVVIDAHMGGGLGILGIASAHAIVFAVMVTATMSISGGHLNPAVTFGLWLAKKIDTRMGALYVMAQVLAGVVAAVLVRWLFPAGAGEITGFGVPRISGTLTGTEALVVEAVLTLFLVSAVFGTLVSREAPKVGGFGIGLVLLFDILVGGPLTGAAVNPARAFGPAVLAQEWHGHYIYWAGPILGGAAAALLWAGLLLPRNEERSAGKGSDK
jgi:aquaporin Z